MAAPIEREQDVDTLHGLLRIGEGGDGGATLIEGEAGCGKTSLLRGARDAGTASGLRVLAAAGASNRDIAQTLFLSPRTIEMHLSHAYRKLGIDGRHGLAAATTR